MYPNNQAHNYGQDKLGFEKGGEHVARVFKVEHEELEGDCAVCPRPVVLLSHLVLDKIDALMKEYKSSEWLAYLIGEGLYAEDMLVPKQDVSFASVEVLDYPESKRIIGVIHSHGNFGSFHSGIDNEYLVGNHNISVVVSKDKMTAKVRTLTPCNKLLIQEADVEPARGKLSGFLGHAKKQIHSAYTKYVTTYPYTGD